MMGLMHHPDLHGFWDEDVKTLGKQVRGQADIQDISNNAVPLWFDGLDPKKINFGLAMYGRGYTLADKSCNSLLCSFTGPSKKGECTDSDGVMSLGEIQDLIKSKSLKPTYLKDSLMKQITWDDQWVGYDGRLPQLILIIPHLLTPARRGDVCRQKGLGRWPMLRRDHGLEY